MGKIVIKRSSKKNIITNKLFKEEVIDEYQLESIKQDDMNVFYSVDKAKMSKKLKVVVQEGQDLNNVIRNMSNVRHFVDLINRMIFIIDYCKQLNQSTDNLEVHRDYIFVGEYINKMKFIYWPIKNPKPQNNICNLFRGIAMALNPAESVIYKQYVDFFDDIQYFDYNKFKNMIKDFKNMDDYLNAREIKEEPVNHVNTENNGGRSLDFSRVQEPTQQDDIIAHGSKRLNTQQDTTLLNAPNNNQATTVLGANDGTTVLGAQDFNQMNYPYLIRTMNNERIDINKPIYRIGKEKQYVDYFISSNPAISRSHCDIVEKNNHYYVIDRNSTNHTYVNDVVITPENEVELFSGTKLKLANEEFIFYM